MSVESEMAPHADTGQSGINVTVPSANPSDLTYATTLSVEQCRRFVDRYFRLGPDSQKNLAATYRGCVDRIKLGHGNDGGVSSAEDGRPMDRGVESPPRQ